MANAPGMVRICRQLNTTNNIPFSQCNKQFTGSRQSKHACTGLSQTDVKYCAMPQKPHQLKNSQQANHTRTEPQSVQQITSGKHTHKHTHTHTHTQDADNTHIFFFFTCIELFLCTSHCYHTETKKASLSAHLWSKQASTKHPGRHIKDVSGPGSRATQIRSHPIWKCTLYAPTNFSKLHWAPSLTEDRVVSQRRLLRTFAWE